jgi:hypothetical protein
MHIGFCFCRYFIGYRHYACWSSKGALEYKAVGLCGMLVKVYFDPGTHT